MKIKITTIALLLSVSAMSMACNGGKYRSKKHNDNHRAKFVSSLNLDAAQKKQFDIIMSKKKDRMHTSMKSIHEETKAQLEKILSPEQMLQLDNGKREHGGKGKRRHHNR